MTQPKIEIKPDNQSSLSFTIAKQVKESHLSLAQIFDLPGELGFFDTGFMPQKHTGLINYRRGGGRETFVYQVDAGIHTVIWGESEGSKDAVRLQLAMPYRIIIGDHAYYNGTWHMVGARHFYSPTPVKSWSTPLYNCNVPNLNCRGYSGTGVGWICLYRTDSYAKQDMYQRIMSTVQRTSGNEAYNDNNMDETDGPRYYRDLGKPEYFWDKGAWSKKTKKEGFEWTLDPELLVPVMIEDPAKISMALNSGNRHATLFDLTRGIYNAYYTDDTPLKPANIMDQSNPFLKDYDKAHVVKTFQYISKNFDARILNANTWSGFNWVPKIAKKKCAITGKEYPETDEFIEFYDKDLNKAEAHYSVAKKLISAVAKLEKDGNVLYNFIMCLPKDTWKNPYNSKFHVSVPKGPQCSKCEMYECDNSYISATPAIKNYGVCRNCMERFRCKACAKNFTIDHRATASVRALKPTEVSQKQKNMVMKAVQAGVNLKNIKIEITHSEDLEDQPEDLCKSCDQRGMDTNCACRRPRPSSKTQTIPGVSSPVCNECIMVDSASKHPIYIPKQVNHSITYSEFKMSSLQYVAGLKQPSATDITKVTGI